MTALSIAFNTALSIAFNNKRVVFVGLVIVALATGFWSGSRYPQLDDKAFMGGDAMLEDPLSFEALVELQIGDPLWKQITYTTINWVNTNRQGMTFGILLGAAFLTLLKMLRRRSYGNGFGNTILGMVMGAPLGVCVNCAAPIAKGIHHAGARLETTLAAMFSSPTLNVVVLTMMFSLFPPYLAITKLAFTLLFILIVIPVMTRYVFRAELAKSVEAAACAIPDGVSIRPDEGWVEASIGATKDLARSLWFIVRTTVPLMLLAGFLGAALANFLPLEEVADVKGGVMTMLLVAAVGLFLPVPMAFDVVICAGLLAAGMPVLYVMILLFTLGIYSVYSYFIVSNTISRRVAVGLSGVLLVMAVIAGIGADGYHEWELRRIMESLEKDMAASGEGAPGAGGSAIAAMDVWGISAQAKEVPGSLETVVERIDHQPRSPAGDKPFTSFEGGELGLEKVNTFSVHDFLLPFWSGHGVGSGDFNNDGWVDVVSGSDNGVLLFANRNGKRFVKTAIDIPELENLQVYFVAFVDVNDDGWLDLYFTTYADGNYYILNNNGRFERANFRKVPNKPTVLTRSMAFGDIDRDGDLDAVLGNFVIGFDAKKGLSKLAKNRVQFNLGEEFEERDLTGITGETLSVLLSDFNGDNRLDLAVGNDFIQPDVFYFGEDDGVFREITKQDGIIPISTWATMSIDTADIDNDMIMDMYIVAISTSMDEDAVRPERRDRDLYCQEIVDPEVKAVCERNIQTSQIFHLSSRHRITNIKKCRKIEDEQEARDCEGMTIFKIAKSERRQKFCKVIASDQKRPAFLCDIIFGERIPTTEAEFARAIPQAKNQNVLLMGSKDGKFLEKSDEMNLTVTGFSWNAKFADLNNDEWQDVYVGNGGWQRLGASNPNSYLINQQGKGFVERGVESGVADYMIVTAFTYLDIDNDGDLDIVTNTINGPLKVYINNETANNSITVELRDRRGNRFGIGAKIIIHYGDGGSRRQIREIKAGGGYLSFDAPVAHFGLAKFEQVSKIEVVWFDGERTELEGPLPAGALYRIERLGGPHRAALQGQAPADAARP